ncbi:MAG: N-acyl homoserine lactonase family protein [Oscillospiraceae bacterium]|nr:N-acyl homoserine lactonase family protein [Oscillospiraceae bacterium]
MRVFVLDLGCLTAEKDGIVHRPGREDHSRITLPLPAFLIDHPEGKILYDTGCHPDAMNGWWQDCMVRAYPFLQSPEQRLENQLALCGVKPEEISAVVLSHLHLDHTGGLSLFPGKPVYAPKKHLAHAMSRISHPDRECHSGYILGDLTAPVEFRPVEGDLTLLPGVELINLPGHTEDLLGMVLHLKSSVLILPQDAVYTAENYGPPVVPTLSLGAPEQYTPSVERVRRLQRETGGMVVFGHDAGQFAALKKAPDWYE